MKTILEYLLFIVAGLAIGFGAVKAYNWVVHAEPPRVVQGDYSAHIEATGEEVVLYGTKSCPYCAKTRDYFEQQGIAYANIEVDEPLSEEIAALYTALKIEAVPIVITRGQRMVGFMPDEFKKIKTGQNKG